MKIAILPLLLVAYLPVLAQTAAPTNPPPNGTDGSSGSTVATSPTPSATRVESSSQSWRSIISAAKGSVFCLHMSNTYTDEDVYGSGFIVQAPDLPGGMHQNFSYLVTNLHMVEGNREGKILNSDDANFKVYGLVHADIINDIAILQVPYIACNKMELDNILSPTLELGVGDDIAVFGYPTYPDFIDGALSTGIVSAFVRKRNEITGSIITQFLQVTAQVSDGSSGSPVFSRSGKVVGLITKRFRPDEKSSANIGIAALAGSVHKLLTDLKQWDSERGPAVVPLQYIRQGFRAEDLSAVITPTFRDFTDADQRSQLGEKHIHAKKLLEIADQSALVHFQMGMTKHDLVLTDDAIASLTRATEIDENYSAAWFQLGRVCIAKHKKMLVDKKTEGIKDLVQLAIKACSNAQKLLDIAPTHYLLGEALLLDSRIADAAKHFEIAFQKNPDDVVIGVAYLYMLDQQGRSVEAKELYSRLLMMSDKIQGDAKTRFENTAKRVKSR
jgi:S1-C subfamily serine protease